MLNPKDILAGLVSAIQQIPTLQQALSVEGQVRIAGYRYLLGTDEFLARALQKMASPSMLITWEGTLAGGARDIIVWKHRFAGYLRMASTSSNSTPLGYDDLWWALCNEPVGASGLNLRYTQIVDGADIMETPTITPMMDDDSIDFFKVTFVIPEIGDN